MKHDNSTDISVKLTGRDLLAQPLLNKDTAFTLSERKIFQLEGLLPNVVETIEQQVERVYQQFKHISHDIDKNSYLRALQDTNETLFFRLVETYTAEMLPIIYTPTVGEACIRYSSIYRQPRGIFISYPDRDHLDDILSNVTQDVKVIVVTDGERILGLGDQGIGGMGIPVGKLSLYTACGGINPAHTLPILLDVGTNNPQHQNDPHYLGWQHARIAGPDYEQFIELFIQAIKRRWPNVLLQFEDFAQKNAMPILEQYRDQLCCFNDDIQGTASVTVGTLLAACKAQGKPLHEQRIVFLGAGSAGCGIAEQIIQMMEKEGLPAKEARKQIFMLNSRGLILDTTANLYDFQIKLAQPSSLVKTWQYESENINLFDVVANVKPTVLIGVSGQPKMFTEQIIKQMYQGCKKPIVMPLSNPTSRIEAAPEDIIKWTKGNAIIATGSPFNPISYEGKLYLIAQCNNAYIFPGIGLGILSSHATRVTENMMLAASEALAETSPMIKDGKGPLLPDVQDIQSISKHIAFSVGKMAQKDGVAPEMSDSQLHEAIHHTFWMPSYAPYKKQ